MLTFKQFLQLPPEIRAQPSKQIIEHIKRHKLEEQNETNKPIRSLSAVK